MHHPPLPWLHTPWLRLGVTMVAEDIWVHILLVGVVYSISLIPVLFPEEIGDTRLTWWQAWRIDLDSGVGYLWHSAAWQVISTITIWGVPAPGAPFLRHCVGSSPYPWPLVVGWCKTIIQKEQTILPMQPCLDNTSCTPSYTGRFSLL